MTAIKFKKLKPFLSFNIDTEILEKVNQILVDDSKPLLIQFIENGQFPKLLTSWSYYASTNDHASFVDTSVKLSKLLGLINVTSGIYKEPSSEDVSYQVTILGLRSQIVDIYKEILQNYLKFIYRALNNNKQSLTNPILRMLSHIVNYDTSTANEFLNTFDLSLNILPKLLLPSKSELEDPKVLQVGKEHLSVRYNFIKFWIDLNSKVAYFHRKDLLITNPKIMNNLWKHMVDADTSTTLTMIIKFLDEKVLHEPNFKRSTKCKVLNENFMHKIQLLFNRIEKKSDENLYIMFIEFLEKLTCTSKYGLVFPNDKLWQVNTSSGIAVKINSSTFRINNNLIYTFLTTLKPWEAFNQMQLAVKLLEANPELIPIYMNWMVQHGGGYHDPSLTSWWIGHTLLYSNILQLPIPKSLIQNEYISVDASYSSKIILENIALAPISKSSLVKTLECDKYMLVQYAAQLIMFSLRKLKLILKSKLSINRQEIVDLVFSHLPDISKIVEVYNKILEKFPIKSDLKLSKLTLVSILKEYETLNSSASATSLIVVKLTNSGIGEIIDNIETSSDYDLALLDCYFSILAVQDKEQELKWWNKNEKSNSLFTSMIILSTKKDIALTFSTKVLNLLSS
jgi:nucleolar pre-ribosomal-associated protein 1